MRYVTAFIVLSLCGTALVSCTPSTLRNKAEVGATAVVAKVNGVAIKKGEYTQALQATYQHFQQAGQLIDGDMREQVKQEVLESLINLIVLDDYSQTLSIVVDEGAVEKHYQEAVSTYASKSAYHEALEEAGLTDADARARIRRILAAQKVVTDYVSPKITVTDEEVKKYYDANADAFEHDVRVHAAHILIKVAPFADDETRKLAQERIRAIQKKIQAGEDFAQLAKTYSEGPSKVNGGDLGYFSGGQMAPAFATAALSLQPGEVSDVVTTQFGYHLIKVYDREPAGRVPFSEAAPILKQRFFRERLDAALQELVESLKAKAKIERFALD
jgi:peptidyl-prolyl cis-trans isomerase C